MNRRRVPMYVHIEYRQISTLDFSDTWYIGTIVYADISAPCSRTRLTARTVEKYHQIYNAQ